MKTLAESIFDVDDIEKLDSNFGSYYKLAHFGFQDDNTYYTSKKAYDYMFSHFKLADLKKNYKPTDISKVQYGTFWSPIDYNEIKTYLKPLEYIVSLINSIVIPPPDSFLRTVNFTNELINLIREKTSKYLKDRNIRFSAYYSYGNITVAIIDDRHIRHDDNIYTMNLTFEEK